MQHHTGDVTVGGRPRLLPQEVVLPVAWDNCVAKARPLPPDPAVAPTTPLRLVDGAKLRREHERGFVQIGQYVYPVDAAGADLLAGFTTAKVLRAAAEDADFMAQMAACGVLVPARSGERSTAELFFFGAEHPVTHLCAPLSLEFEITNKCFRRCTYCAYGSGPDPIIDRSAELLTEDWLRLIDEAADLGLMVLEFTGGDPFVRGDAFELMKRASDRGVTLLVNSDLSVLTEEHLEWLRELPTLHAVQTSLDGATAESCDRTRGPGGFRTLVKQLRRLAGAGLPVSVGTTVHAGNHAEVADIARLAADNGASRFYVAPMYAAGRAAALAAEVVTTEQWSVAVVQYAEAIIDGVIEPTDIGWARIAPRVAGGDLTAVVDQVHLTTRGNRGLRVDPRGGAYVTAKLRELHPRFGTVGSVADVSLEAVWHGSRQLAALRALPASNRYFDAVDLRGVPQSWPVGDRPSIRHLVHVDLRSSAERREQGAVAHGSTVPGASRA